MSGFEFDEVGVVIPLLAAGLPLVVLIAAVRTLRDRHREAARREMLRPLREVEASIRGARGEARVAEALAALGVPTLHDVILTDASGVTQIDHIALGRDAIVVLETKTLAGAVRGSVDGRMWEQRVPGTGQIRRFQNPHRQNYRHVRAVAELLGDLQVPIRGYVVAAGTAEFDRHLAGTVTRLEDLSLVFSPSGLDQVDAGRLQAAWRCIEAAAHANGVPRGPEEPAILPRRLPVWPARAAGRTKRSGAVTAPGQRRKAF